MMELLPDCIQHWILGNFKITTVRRDRIREMLVNLRPCAKGEGVQCNCAKLQKMHNNKLPMANGHVAFVGDWYCGPCKHVLTQNCDNVPKPDERLDARRLQKQMDKAIN